MRAARALWLVPFVFSAACFLQVSGGQPAVQAIKPGTPQAVQGQGGVTGSWVMSYPEAADEATGARYVTEEEWVLGQTGDNIAGYYEIRTRFTSADGSPYQCSGTNAMFQAARYQIHGGISNGMVRIFEDAVASSDDPCDRRQLAPGASHAGKVVSPTEIQLDEGRRVLTRKQ